MNEFTKQTVNVHVYVCINTSIIQIRGQEEGGQGGGHGSPIKSGQGAKKGHIFWPYLAYLLLTNIS